MKANYKFILAVLMAVICFSVSAQQDAQFTHYGFNGMYLNPGYAGIQKAPVFRAMYRNQWMGYESDFDDGTAGNTELFSADVPILAIKGGLGINIVNDIQPSMRNTSINLALSKHIVIAKGVLGIGIQGSYANVLMGRKDIAWRPSDGAASIPNDFAIPDQNKWVENLMDLSAGFWYEKKDYYVGISVNKLLEDDYSFGALRPDSLGTISNGTQRHMYITAGYHVKLDRTLMLTPTFLFKTDFASSMRQTHSFELGARLDIDKKHWGGLNFRQGGAFGFLIGTSVLEDKQMKIGYAMDIVVAGVAAKAGTSHEIMIAYYLPEITKIRPIMRTPRYKH